VRFPTRILKALGIETKVELPGVGENLVEQPNLILAYSGDLEPSSNAYHTFATAADLFGSDVAAVEASTLANLSKWAQTAVDASGSDALNVTAIEKLLHIQHDLLFKQNVTAAEVLTVVAPQGLLASNYWILLPFSRGSVHLGSADKINEPLIDPRFFLANFDLNATVATGKLTQRFWLSEPMNNVVTGPLIPGPDVLPNDATDAQWETYVRESGEFFSRSLTCIGD
jgi:choline dehydrogenase